MHPDTTTLSELLELMRWLYLRWVKQRLSLLPLGLPASRTLRAREQWRHDVTRGFERVRLALLAHAESLTVRGVLPSPEALWLLHIDEVRRMEGGWIPDAGFWDSRHETLERLKRYHLPDLLYRFDDLEAYFEPDGVIRLP
jgi:hypothetical protein